mmetsp:Transcript_76934/g.152619  ORF Transcript_76934/g.152619 Transcript_76934/m.152619 type:complete len:240 (+) Transcript_76934:513-1232(+)
MGSRSIRYPLRINALWHHGQANLSPSGSEVNHDRVAWVIARDLKTVRVHEHGPSVNEVVNEQVVVRRVVLRQRRKLRVVQERLVKDACVLRMRRILCRHALQVGVVQRRAAGCAQPHASVQGAQLRFRDPHDAGRILDVVKRKLSALRVENLHLVVNRRRETVDAIALRRVAIGAVIHVTTARAEEKWRARHLGRRDGTCKHDDVCVAQTIEAITERVQHRLDSWDEILIQVKRLLRLI